MHSAATRWINGTIAEHTPVVAHHSVLEAYAVLTRLPSAFRLAPREAAMVLTETLRDKVLIAPFDAEDIWSAIFTVETAPAAGGASYDAFIIHLLRTAGVQQIATFNTRDFERLADGLKIVTPEM
jgi:predicted nucleic acid-binding protein